jgi:hypothetical protein
MTDNGELVVVLDNVAGRSPHLNLHLFLGCGQIALLNGDMILHHTPAE